MFYKYFVSYDDIFLDDNDELCFDSIEVCFDTADEVLEFISSLPKEKYDYPVNFAVYERKFFIFE